MAEPGRKIYLREWRLYRNLTQAELSKRTGIGAPQISRFESRKVGPRPISLTKLAAALDCEPWELYGIPKPLAELETAEP